MKKILLGLALLLVVGMGQAAHPSSAQEAAFGAFTIPDTAQTHCYPTGGSSTPCPAQGEAVFGQDANYLTATPAYQDNGDGTVSDLVTGLMWEKTSAGKATWDAALQNAPSITTGGYTDWRLPTIKELYSLMNFMGITAMDEASSVPYLDTTYFDFSYGDTSAGERFIDAQYWSSTEYGSTTMGGNETVFGVNFADGRIKGYPKNVGANPMMAFVRYVRGNPNYGVNQFIDNNDGTITDAATGLTWLQADSGSFNPSPAGDGALDWAEALTWCENLVIANVDDWRLPNVKELQSLVDYSRTPDTTNSAAINPIFSSTAIMNELGVVDYPAYWSSTTHLDGMPVGSFASYVNFGESLGYMQAPNSTTTQLTDVHGAGAQRSDPKTGSAADYPTGHGPQGDVVRVKNFARCVRGGVTQVVTGGEADPRIASLTTAAPVGQGGQTPPQPQTVQDAQPPAPPAQDNNNNNNNQDGGRRQPPQEAIDACTGLTEGAVCSFTTPNGNTRTGTCETRETLACRPEGGGRQGGGDGRRDGNGQGQQPPPPTNS